MFTTVIAVTVACTYPNETGSPAPSPTTSTTARASTTSTSAGNPATTTTSSTTTTPSAPGAHPPNHNPNLPTIDRSKIPTGVRGSSEFLIKSTNEPPAPTAADDIGAFRTVCSFSHMNFDDPLLFPGQVGAAHLHSFFGNTIADANTTGPDQLRVPQARSTCRGGTANLSAYWLPSLIDTRNGTPLRPVDGMDVYYKSGYNGVPPERIRPIPKGLRLLAGNAAASSDQTGVTGQWGCSANTSYQYSGGIPACPGGQRVSMEVRFPQCLKVDGAGQPLLDSPDHRSHAAYGQHPQGCPSTHPYAIPVITYVVDWTVPSGTDSSVLRLSSDAYQGGPGGYSRHADYIEGWDDTVRDQFVRNCSSKHADCHSNLLGANAQGQLQTLGFDEANGIV